MPQGQEYPRIVLKKGRESSVLRFHPWVFSGAVWKIEGEPKEGDTVEVFSSDGRFLALGHFGEESIAARLFAFERVSPDRRFWADRFQKAFDLRKALGLVGNKATTAYRLINAEGDGMPCLIVDIYEDAAVLQCHSKGMHRQAVLFREILEEIYNGRLRAVIDKPSGSLTEEAEEGEHRPLGEGRMASSSNQIGSLKRIKENDCLFEADLSRGQKTGFFLDQRENRKLLKAMSKGRKVLDAFAYSGGFSVHALTGGAKEVVSVDASKEATRLVERNVSLNFVEPPHRAVAADCFEFLKGMGKEFDLIVLDPPAFAKHRAALKKAVKGYTTINAFALKKIKRGGLLFTFSCSQFFDRVLFQKVLFSAAAETGREIRILYRLSQGPDHPVSIYHPEGEYLKGFVLHVQ